MLIEFDLKIFPGLKKSKSFISKIEREMILKVFNYLLEITLFLFQVC